MINSNNLFKELGLPESPITEYNQDNNYYEEYEQDPRLGQKKKLILELTINLTPDYSSTIKLYEGDQPEVLAQEFGKKHSLSSEAVEVIIEHINNHFPNEKLTTVARLGKENSHQQLNSIFDRLHREAIKKKQRQQEREMIEEKRTNSQLATKSTSKSSLTTNHNNLYAKGLRYKQEIEKANEEKRLQYQEEQMKEYTFKPKVSKKSLQIMKQKGSKTPNVKHEDQLIQQGIQQNERKRTASFLKNTIQETTFKPQVNQISNRIVQEKTKRSQTIILQDKCEQLYNMAKQIQAKKGEQYKKEEVISFRPKINNSQSDRQYIPFLERVDMTLKLRNEKLKMDEQNQLIDQSSGQLLYKPKICRPPKIERKRGGLPVWDYLFQHQKKEDSMIQFNNDQVDESKWNKSITERSDILVTNMRRQRLEEFFCIMDSDKDGFISADACNLEDLPIEALELLQPVLLQMEQFGVSMNMDIWVDKALLFSSTLSVADKNRLYQKKRTQKDDLAEMFNPKINKKSHRIAQQKRNYSGCEGLYENYQNEIHSKEIKRQQIIKNQIDKERQQCTFQPRINTSFK